MPLSQLRRITARGQGVTLALTGEAGVGKSERAQQFLNTLAARAFSFAAQWPLSRLSAVLPPATREPEWVTALFARLALGESLPAADLATAVAERLSAHAPALLVVDHFHRAALDTLPFWEALARRVQGGKSVGLLVLTRGEAPAGWETEEVLPLTSEESDTLLKNRLGEAYRPDLSRWIFEKARGHPLFTLELLSDLQASGRLESGDWATQTVAVPTSIQAFIRAQLPPDLTLEAHQALAKELLRVEMLSSPLPAAATLPESLTRAGLKAEQLTHPLFREALLTIVPPEMWASVLREDLRILPLAEVTLLARLAEAWPLPDDVRVELYYRAAEELESKQQLTLAAEFWEKAARFRPEQRAEWLYRASRLYEFYPLQKDLHLHSLRAIRGAVEAAGTAVSRDWLTRLVSGQGTARLPLEDLAALLPGSLEDWRNDYLDGLFQSATLSDLSAVREWDALSESERLARPPLALNGIATVLGYIRPVEAQEIRKRALAGAGDELSRLRILADAAYIPFFLMDNETALREFDAVVRGLEQQQARLAAKRSGWTLEMRLDFDRTEQLIQTSNRARAALLGRLGHLDKCMTLYDTVLSYAARRQALTLYAGTLQRYGWDLVHPGRFEEAQRLLRQALSTGLTINFILMAQIELYFLWSRDEQAHLLAHATSELQATMADAEVVPLQAYFMAALGLTAGGHWHPALAMLEAGEQQARANNVEHALAYGLWLRALWHGEQGQLAEGARLAQAAAHAARTGGLEREAARYALWGAHYGKDQNTYSRAAEAVKNNGDLGHLHAVESRRQTSAPPAVAHLQVLGAPRLLDAGGQPVRSAAGLQLLLPLLYARLLGHNGLSEAELTRQLYPELAEEGGRRNVKRLIRRLNDTLGPGAVVQAGTVYTIGHLSSDAELFLNEGAADLWRGPLPLSSEPLGSLVAERLLARLREHVTALLANDPAQAARLAAFLTESEPYDVSALRLRLHAHDLAGQVAQARSAYAASRQTLAEVGEHLPPDWRTFLASGTAPILTEASLPPVARAASRARALQVHRSTITRRDTGKALTGRVGRPARVTPQQVATLRQMMAAAPADAGLDAPRWTLKLAAEQLEKAFGVRLSQSQLSRLLRQA